MGLGCMAQYPDIICLKRLLQTVQPPSGRGGKKGRKPFVDVRVTSECEC